MKDTALFSYYPENPSENIPNKASWICFLTTSQYFFPQFATFKIRGWGGIIQIKNERLNMSSYNQWIWWRTPTTIQWCQKEYTHFIREKIFCISRAVNFLFLTTVCAQKLNRNRTFFNRCRFSWTLAFNYFIFFFQWNVVHGKLTGIWNRSVRIWTSNYM